MTVQRRARTSIRIALVGAAATVAALAMPPTPAISRTYTVLSCQDRDGAATPSGDETGGWTAGTSGQAGLAAVDRCFNATRDLLAAVSGPSSYPIGARAWWRFVAPPDTVIDSFGLQYWASARPFDSRNQGLVSMVGSQSGRLLNLDGTGYSAPSWYSLSQRHDSYVELAAQCDGPASAPSCDANQVHAEVHIQRSEFVLSDAQPPQVQSVGGSAVDASTWNDIVTFTLAATDRGGGVYQATLDVDGVPTLTQPIDEWAGRCVDATFGQHVFRYPRPCLTSVDAVVPVDTSALPAGSHEITLRISDAAGNARAAYSARKTLVVPGRTIGPGSPLAERGAPNGDNAADAVRLTARWVHSRRSTLIGPFGRRQVIRGRLTEATGVGLRNARIELLTAIDHRVGQPIDKGGARTRGDGRFTIILPGNASSRTLVLRYRSHANDTVAAAQRVLALKVRAGAKLTVTPRLASRGQTVRLRGRLAGRPLPEGGKVIELQARSPGHGWLTFRTVRSNRRGRFATSYTFRRGGPALYEMRARVRATDDYPFATGFSRAVRVRVR